MSLRWKVAALLAVIVSIGVAAVSYITYRTTDTRLMEEVDRSLVQATERFLQRPNANRPFRPGNTVINIPERPLGIEQFVVQVSDRSGEVLASTEGVSLPTQSVDVNDLGRGKVLASCPGCDEALLMRALRPNPAGNANERTPLVLVRP